jgi:hypothetical protein
LDACGTIWADNERNFGFAHIAIINRLSQRFSCRDPFANEFLAKPLLSMFLLVFFGTFLEHGVFMLGLFVQGISFSLAEVFTQILLPSVLLNMLLTIPIHALVQEVFRNAAPMGTEI